MSTLPKRRLKAEGKRLKGKNGRLKAEVYQQSSAFSLSEFRKLIEYLRNDYAGGDRQFVDNRGDILDVAL